jgi:phosphatidylinositol alpha-1,6-mannosyltransferase
MQTHAMYLSQHLADAGHEVQAVTYYADEEARKASLDFDSQLGFKVHRLLSRISYWHNIDILKRIAYEFQPDLIYCSTVFYGLLRDSVSVPVICRSVGNDVLRPWIAYPFRRGSRLLGASGIDNWAYNVFKRMDYPDWLAIFFYQKRRALVEKSVHEIDVVIANSDFTAGLFNEMGIPGNKVRVLVGGVDAGRFAPNGDGQQELRRELGIDENAYVITTVCRLVAKKGVDFLLRSLPAVRYLIPRAHLLIVGEGRDSKHYRRLAQDLQLDRVTFAGRIDHLQVQRYYWLSDLFVLASRVKINPVTNQKDAETMGRVLCEANAAGVPVVAARSGGIPSVITHEKNGLLFNSDDEQDFLEQIIKLVRQPAMARTLVDNGLNVANQKFDWSVVLQAHEHYFGELVTDYARPKSDR